MKVLTPDGARVALCRLRKRQFIWSNSLVFKGTFKTFVVPGYVTMNVARNNHLAEIAAGAFDWESQDGFLTITNMTAITGVVTTKGLGAGTVITESGNAVEGLASVEKLG
jgi:hypothetical protein